MTGATTIFGFSSAQLRVAGPNGGSLRGRFAVLEQPVAVDELDGVAAENVLNAGPTPISADRS